MTSTEPSKVYAAVGSCIYCGSSDDLRKEHIIPLGLGGNWILPKASCKSCGTTTGKFEQFCLRPMLGPLRIRMKLPTRRPNERPSNIEIEFIDKKGARKHKNFSVENIPALCMGYRWPAPGLLRNISSSDQFEGNLVVRTFNDELKPHLDPDGTRMKLGSINIAAFARMLAKIGHSYAIAELGLNGFSPMLPDLILGKSTDLPYLVGGDASSSPLTEFEQELHSVYLQNCISNGVIYILASIRLFSFLGMPRYHVVVGKAHA